MVLLKIFELHKVEKCVQYIYSTYNVYGWYSLCDMYILYNVYSMYVCLSAKVRKSVGQCAIDQMFFVTAHIFARAVDTYLITMETITTIKTIETMAMWFSALNHLTDDPGNQFANKSWPIRNNFASTYTVHKYNTGKNTWLTV